MILYNQHMTTVRAHSNIALIKYWGKRSGKLKTPQNDSISLTLDQLYTDTTVSYEPHLKQDTLKLNGEVAPEPMRQRIQGFMDFLRRELHIAHHAAIDSVNHFPTGAGLASSASAFAALTLAATLAADQSLPTEHLSRLARQGSGSASRSLYGGFARWHAGRETDGSDSLARPIVSSWKPIMVVLVLTAAHKKIGSGDGMQRTVDTSPLYGGWLDSIGQNLAEMEQGIAAQDFEKVGTLMEHNALKMHATALAAQPAVLYWEPATVALIHHVWALRQEGLPCYLTMDAGPNVKVLLPPDTPDAVIQRVVNHPEVLDSFVCRPGPAAHRIDL